MRIYMKKYLYIALIIVLVCIGIFILFVTGDETQRNKAILPALLAISIVAGTIACLALLYPIRIVTAIVGKYTPDQLRQKQVLWYTGEQILKWNIVVVRIVGGVVGLICVTGCVSFILHVVLVFL